MESLEALAWTSEVGRGGSSMEIHRPELWRRARKGSRHRSQLQRSFLFPPPLLFAVPLSNPPLALVRHSFMIPHCPTNTNPIGNADTCNPANEELLELVGMAGEAWYSKDPEHKEQHGLTYRKHPNGRFFYLREGNYGYYSAELHEMRAEGKIFALVVRGYDVTEQMPWTAYRYLLDYRIPSGLSAGSNRTLFDENYTAYNDHSPFWHRCANGTTKQLIFEPGGEKLQVMLSKGSSLFKGEDDGIASRMLRGFLNNLSVNQGLAFDHFESLTHLQRHNLENLAVKKEKRTLKSTLKWFEYAPGSGYYFRKITDDEIQQYDPNPRKRKTFIRPRTLSSASLTHRKMRIYGFTRGGETQAI